MLSQHNPARLLVARPPSIYKLSLELPSPPREAGNHGVKFPYHPCNSRPHGLMQSYHIWLGKWSREGKFFWGPLLYSPLSKVCTLTCALLVCYEHVVDTAAVTVSCWQIWCLSDFVWDTLTVDFFGTVAIVSRFCFLSAKATSHFCSTYYPQEV